MTYSGACSGGGSSYNIHDIHIMTEAVVMSGCSVRYERSNIPYEGMIGGVECLAREIYHSLRDPSSKEQIRKSLRESKPLMTEHCRNFVDTLMSLPDDMPEPESLVSAVEGMMRFRKAKPEGYTLQ